MKKILLAFLVLGFFATSNAYAVGKDDKEDKMAGWVTDKINDAGEFITYAYNNVMKLVQSTTASLKNAAYNKMRNIMNSEIIISLLGLIIFFWLYKLLKNGGSIGKEEIYKAMTFVIIFIFVYVILNSKTAFNEVMDMFKLPSRILQEVFGGQNSTQNALVKVFGEPFMKTFKVFFALYQSYTNSVSFFGTQYLTGIPFAGVLMILYLFYILVALAVILGVVVIQSYSIFLEGIYTSFAPLVILLLLIPQTKGIFFAWLKSYIGITLYVPLSGIAIKILAANPASISTDANQINQIVSALFIFSMTGLLLAILAISILSKIPTWIGELLGATNQGVGMGGAISMAKMAGDGLGKAANATVGKATRNLGSAASDALKGDSVGQKLGSATSSAASMATSGMVSKDGFKAMGRFIQQAYKNSKTKQ